MKSDVIAFPYECMNSYDYLDLCIINFIHRSDETNKETKHRMTLDSDNLMVFIKGLMRIYDTHQDKHNARVRDPMINEFFTRHGEDMKEIK